MNIQKETATAFSMYLYTKLINLSILTRVITVVLVMLTSLC